MTITNLEEKENRKIWVPIRPGNRGGWSLFEWEKVREMPYRDREMYLGNSAKIGILDKGGKWRKKDWYLHRNELGSGETLNTQMLQTMRRDQARMKAALGLNDSDEEEEKLTPAEMQLLLKKVRGNKEEGFQQVETGAAGLGFDKLKVEIRARPNAKGQNPHRLQGNAQQFEAKYAPKSKKEEPQDKSRSRSRSEKKKKKHKKEKHSRREREPSGSEQRHKKKHKHRSRSRQHKERKEKKHKEHKERRPRNRSQSR